jgi:hypothetical protein
VARRFLADQASDFDHRHRRDVRADDRHTTKRNTIVSSAAEASAFIERDSGAVSGDVRVS